MNEALAEHDRLVKLVYAKAQRLTDLGRAREADRWRAFAAWLRAQPPHPTETHWRAVETAVKKPLDLST